MNNNKLTAEDIDSLPAGRDLDCLIAESVMGWNKILEHGHQVGKLPDRMETCYYWTTPAGDYNGGMGHDEEFSPSTNIADAWVVAEKSGLSLLQRVIWENEQGWTWNAYCGDSSGSERKHAYADTAPLAICRSALKAINV